MSYLAIIERLKKGRVDTCGDAPQASGHYEKNEFNEKSPVAPTGPAECDAELLPLGRKNDLGELVMTVDDLPELEHRLRLSGWKVERRGYQLICRTGRAKLQ